MSHEYRVVWRREHDKSKRTRIYQTQSGAEDFARFLRVSTVEEMTDDEWGVLGDNLTRLGDAVDVVVESRPVGEWVEEATPNPTGSEKTMTHQFEEPGTSDMAEMRLLSIVEKATPYGEQDGGFIAYYIIPTGPIHRAILHLQQHGYPIPNPSTPIEGDVELQRYCLEHDCQFDGPNAVICLAAFYMDADNPEKQEPCEPEIKRLVSHAPVQSPEFGVGSGTQ